MAGIDTKWLKGLTFRTSESRTVREDGQTVVRHFPVERALKPENVLDFKEYGTEIIIVAADGQKHRVVKKEEKNPGAGGSGDK